MEYKILYLNGERIRYIKEGRGQTLVFLHGFSIRPHNYKILIEELSESFEVLAPDMYGTNYLKNQPKTIDEYAELTHDFCQKFNTGRCYLSGHSLGGQISFILGEEAPCDVGLIIAINPMITNNPNYSNFLIGPLKTGIRKMLGFYGGLKSIPRAMRISLESIINILRNLNASASNLSDITKFNYDSLAIKQPTLILFGDRDEYFTLDDRTEEQINKAFCQLEIKRLNGYGHDWPLFKGEETAQHIKDFLKI